LSNSCGTLQIKPLLLLLLQLLLNALLLLLLPRQPLPAQVLAPARHFQHLHIP
jgi:hypothetical protein